MPTLLQNLGIVVDANTGHLFYSEEFKPVQIDFDLIFIRHGETYGNCGQTTEHGTIDTAMVNSKTKDKEKRIFQGNVDKQINQLTKDGEAQAQEAAKKLTSDFLDKGWMPDVIFHSPLKRAKNTAKPFIKKNKLKDKFVELDGIREMSFGTWDNRRVCDFSPHDPCHTFYREQHALVENGGESFCDVLLRAHDVLQKINEDYRGKKVIMFSHSMFGAACCILLGKGQKIENGNYLAFDGARKDGSYYTMPHATPFCLNSVNFDNLEFKTRLLSTSKHI